MPEEPNDTATKLDAVYDEVDDLLRAGKFSEVDEKLRQLNVTTGDMDILIAYLTATLPAKPKLKDRDGFYQKIALRVIQEYELGEAEDILRGLD